MFAGHRLSQPKSPEWLHSGRYLLIALALHALLFLFPLSLNVDSIAPTPPVQVKLAERLSAPQALPQPKSKNITVPKPVYREKSARPAHPVIAMAAEQPSTPPSVSAPAPVVAASSVTPAASQSTSAPLNLPPQPVVTAARFNAAYLNNPDPKYPSLSRRLGEEGKVLLRVRVTADGRAAAVDVEKSSNFERLDEAARQSVAHWRFVPAKRGEEPVEASVIVPILFRLDN